MSRTHIPAELRRSVRLRARDCCEYCLMPESMTLAAHEIDHVIAEKRGGPTDADNLALACALWIQHSYCLLFELVRIHEYSPSSSRCAIAA